MGLPAMEAFHLKWVGGGRVGGFGWVGLAGFWGGGGRRGWEDIHRQTRHTRTHTYLFSILRRFSLRFCLRSFCWGCVGLGGWVGGWKGREKGRKHVSNLDG